MVEKTMETAGQKVLTLGMHDAVADGKLITDIPTRLIFVEDENERNALGALAPGTFVATYGVEHVWQRNGADGWETVK